MAVKLKGLKLSGFSSMDSDEQAKLINNLVSSACSPTMEEMKEYEEGLNKKIKAFEAKYGLSSEEMMLQLSKGYIIEDMDICSWLMTLEDLKIFREEFRSPRTK